MLTATSLALIVAMVFGVTAASGEFRHKTATATDLDQPHRVRVLLAKAVAATSPAPRRATASSWLGDG